jgi:drug/metabolite transporter (DMT)-like permease
MEPHFVGFKVLAEPAVWGNIIFLALYASLIAFILWAQANKGLGSVKAGNYMYFQPVITLIASAILLGEAITVVGVTGCALIIAGVWMGDWLTRRNAAK